jgi:uncharacterized cupin superfamily protein
MKPVRATDIPARLKPSVYPEPFASRMQGRVKRALGDFFGIGAFGVNLTELAPGAESSILHRHSKQEEFIYVIEGHPTLVLEDGEHQMAPGSCVGFTPSGPAHKLVNRSSEKVLYLELGNRIEGDEGTYPQDDLVAKMGDDGKWAFFHKDGRKY